MDMEELGYFLYMEQQEKEQIDLECAAVGKDKVDSNILLVSELMTQNENLY